MMRDGVNHFEKEEEVKVFDIAELIASAKGTRVVFLYKHMNFPIGIHIGSAAIEFPFRTFSR